MKIPNKMEELTYYPMLLLNNLSLSVNTGSVTIFPTQVVEVMCDSMDNVIQGSKPFLRVTSCTIAPELYVFHSLLDTSLLV